MSNTSKLESYFCSIDAGGGGTLTNSSFCMPEAEKVIVLEGEEEKITLPKSNKTI